jgi:hypothetical protein
MSASRRSDFFVKQNVVLDCRSGQKYENKWITMSTEVIRRGRNSALEVKYNAEYTREKHQSLQGT